ncbi:c-type cytochrome [Campylobacter canadensis]|uniref:C-type cytochrome n=1 Tax=Campylobacter canadensis TaxID=449520 RepID=A0ABS7WQK8_9BACT|nr:c-type cytochrome [Campylobacter canadensis]MBZ7986622.1 c-type cytochrome [Campylobacter canadensis]MBZ7993973.1 c-type cytochrome [Campylobacter canadensis]MBZ7996289.1 c-type cytochrome [Campylobacter canadensis]MBZ7997658.1 c-type cytochrome [Campylobacter canadensis]MBZ7999305.1 c-type cytochrome [Campylobacter canadensis]
MKKIIYSCLVASMLASGAYAADGATLFKKCIACHGKDASKVPPGGEVASVTLSEQEIVEALKGYRAKTFGGKAKKTMEIQAAKLSDDDINALAAYIVSLKK